MMESDRSAHNRYALMHEQVRIATAVCAGSAVLDRRLFSAMPYDTTSAPIEADGSMTALTDAVYAFASGLYAPGYGPASARQQFKHSSTVASSLELWSASVNDALRSAVRPAAFRRIFFEGGLWHVFIDLCTSPDQGYRQRIMGATNSDQLKKDPTLRKLADKVYPFFGRVPPGRQPSHRGSHFDAARFASAVLDIGEQELGLWAEDDKEELLVNSLPELRRLALLEMQGVNRATEGFLYDPILRRYKKEFLTIDDKRRHVGFNMPAIRERIYELLPDVDTYNYRGCPVIYQTTPYRQEQVPIFSVMNDTLVRLFRTTGALTLPLLRLPL